MEFLEHFKLHIHDKPHLIGNAERTVSGVGSQGIMYTALKTLKGQFGQPSAIARVYISKLVDKRKLQTNDRQALQELSFDVINCVATLKQINHLTDVNATDNLRKIIKRLPDHMIDKWKATAADMREKGETPSLEYISQFFRRRVRAEFHPDFRDIPKSEHRRPGIHFSQRDGGKKPLQCYVCGKNHRVVKCPTLASGSSDEKIQHARDQRLRFSCLNHGHVTRLQIKKKNAE